MNNVLIDREKIDILANAISVKSGEPVTMTLDEMVEAVDGIDLEPNLQSKTYIVEYGGTETVTADSGYDGLSEVEVTVPEADIVPDVWGIFYNRDGHRKWRATGGYTIHGTGWVPTSDHDAIDYNAIPSNTTITPTESAQTIGGANYMMEGAVTVGAISSSYVGSGITRRDSTDLSASGATVSVPSGYYASNATKSVDTMTLPTEANAGQPYGYTTKVTLSRSTNDRYINIPAGYNSEKGSYKIEAVPNGTEGTPTATKGTVSNHAVTVTPSVTNSAGYISGGTHNGTAVSVSASELVSGTYTVDSSGTKDVTNYASASVPSGTAGTPSASKGTVSNHSITVTPSVTNQTGWITGSTKTGTAVTVSASELVSGSETKTANGTYDVTNLAELIVNVSGGGGVGLSVDAVLFGGITPTTSYSIAPLLGEPTSFVILAQSDTITPTSNYKYVASLVYDGSSSGHAFGSVITTTNNAQVTYESSAATFSYNSGSLMVTLDDAYFGAFDNGYVIIYTYGGGSIDTKDVQVGSGATSITFTGLEDEPEYWSCAFKSNFGTSSGYQRVIAVANALSNIAGLEMDSGAHTAQHWTSSYSNGSLTITSQGTNQGGYFHQPGYYQLTYAYDDGSSGNYQSKTVTPTTSQQVVEADSGYDALKRVTVNAIPSSYVQPTSTVGATTYRASTSSQTISSGTYHSAAATIAAVSQTNLSAENIKRGTTISISNGQSNIWSVTGTYTGGGTSKNVQVLQSTSRTNSSSLTKVLGDLTVSKTGTYDIYWSGGRTNTSSSYTWGTRLYVDGTGYGTENTTWTNNCQSNHLSNVSLTANQKLSVYARGRTGSYYTFVPMLTIVEA